MCAFCAEIDEDINLENKKMMWQFAWATLSDDVS
jgi:hypothetical protein